MTKHKPDCKMTFGRKDPSCPRCQELLNGAPPRDGWQKAYFHKKQTDYEQFRRALAAHNCQKSKCGPICTAFDW